MGVIVDTLKDHKQAFESLAGQVSTLAGQMDTLTSQVKDQASLITTLATDQTQILAILTDQTSRSPKKRS